jgi:formate-dependent nitrite reductase membrane component NrfD
MLFADPVQSRTADLREQFRPQREWAEGRGLLLILAHFLTGTGAGAWLFAAFFGLDPGLMVGFSLVGLGAIAHLCFLGRPGRFWRMATHFGSSWISRGLVGMTLFFVVAAFYLLLRFLDVGETTLGRFVLILSLLGAIWVVVYKGFVWGSSKGIPLWNTPMIPALYIAYALRGGAAVLMVMAAIGANHASLEPLEPVKLWLAISTGVLIIVYLEVMRGSGTTSLRSVDLMLFGRIPLPFYLGAVVFGLIIPITIGVFAYLTGVHVGLLGLVGLLSLLGDVSIIYCIAKAGLYRPLPA